MNIDDVLAVAEARRLAGSGRALEIRERVKLSALEVATVIGVAPGTVSRWERGLRSPHGEAAVRYARLLERLSWVGAGRDASDGPAPADKDQEVGK